jgi:hypothetical protein
LIPQGSQELQEKSQDGSQAKVPDEIAMMRKLIEIVDKLGKSKSLSLREYP